MSHLILLRTAPGFESMHRFSFLAFLLVLLAHSATAQTTSNVDGSTPSGLTRGAPSGSYSLSGFEDINLFNGNLDVKLPLLSIGGRGTAGTTLMLPFNLKRWHVENHENEYYSSHMPQQDWWGGLNVGYGPGIVEGRYGGLETRQCTRNYSPYDSYTVSKYTFTTLTYKTPDGTEHELRDQLNNGQPLTSSACNTPTGPTRGTVFISSKGEGITFISDTTINDYIDTDEASLAPSGYLLFRDGARYRIDGGTVSWIRDRNGNKVTFSTVGGVTTIKDSLNRQATIEYNVNDVTPYGLCDRITFKGTGGQPRIIRVSKTSMSNALRSGYTIQSPQQLFPGLDGSSGSYNPTVPWKLWLPNSNGSGQHYQFYQFFYNSYGELARLELPTGGAFEYDMTPGSGIVGTEPWEIYRRLVERRVYPDGTTLKSRTTYDAVQSGWLDAWPWTTTVTVNEMNASSQLLSRSKHYFNGSGLAVLIKETPNAKRYIYSTWSDGQEYQTEFFAADGTTVLRRVNNTFQQRAAVSWWSTWASQQSLNSAREPANDPRPTQAVNTLVDLNKVAKQTFGYDDSVPYNNRNNVKEYDFGNGAAGALLRETRTTFITSSSYTGTNVYLRSLASQVSVYDSGGTERARTTFEYDNYADDTLHDTLMPRSFISGLCDGTTQNCPNGPNFTDQSYIIRGNATSTTHYLLVNGSVTDSITGYAQYDVAGNVVKTIDPGGSSTTIEYDDHFGWADGDARANNAPSELTSQSQTSFAFVTKVINDLGHTTHSQYDYYTGRPVDGEDANGVVSSGYYNDALDRPTQVIKAANQSTAIKNQTSFVYDDLGRTVTTTSDRDALNDNLLKGMILYDGLGRTIETRQYEGGTNYVATKQNYDALGRAYQSSNPYRPWQSETPIWTTSVFDALGRVTSVTTPDSAVVATSYSGNTVTVTDQTRARKSVTDALGRLIQVYEAPNDPSYNYLTSYSYDVLDNLTTVSQGAQTRTFVYNSLKRLTSATNPESGTISYVYDDNGNLTQKTDARLIVTNYAYDALNRNTTVDYSNTSGINPDITRIYDTATNGKGRLTESYAGGTETVGATVEHTKILSYDALGRPTDQRQRFKTASVWSAEYQTQRSYNRAGAVTSQTYPSLRTVAYNYDQAGRLGDKDAQNLAFTGNLGDSVARTYSKGILYSSMGGVTKEQFGTTPTALYNKSFYNSRGQLSEIRVSTSYTGPTDTTWNRGAIINHYSNNCWGMCGGSTSTTAMTDNNGNLKKQDVYVPLNDQLQNAPYTMWWQGYDYDELNRLERVHEYTGNTAVDWQQEYYYDRYGNRSLHQTNTWGAGINKKNFTVSTANNRLGVPAGQTGTMTYDAAGNLTTDTYSGAGVTRAYDAENRMTSETQPSSYLAGVYTYNADGQRVRRKIGGVETRQVYGMDGELLAEYAASGLPASPQKEYGYRNGQLLVTAEPAGAQNVSWQNAVGVSIAGNSLTKTGATGWNAGAASTQTIASGDGYVEFTASETNKHRRIGLSLGNANQSWDDIDFCIYLNADGTVYIGEGATARGNFGAYATGDVMRVAVEGGVVKYRKNGTLLYTSTVAPAYPLLVDTSLYTTASTLNSVVIFSAATNTSANINWLVADQLGTPRMVFDKTGALATTKRHDYLPFGEELFAGQGLRTSGANGLGYTGDTNRQQFTSYERDSETNLDFAQARYYANMQGRFTSVDPLRMSATAGSPQSWNRYAYVGNQPLTSTDPTGMIAKSETADYSYRNKDNGVYGGVESGSWNNSFPLFGEIVTVSSHAATPPQDPLGPQITPCDITFAAVFGDSDAVARTAYEYDGRYRGFDPEARARAAGLPRTAFSNPVWDAEHLYNFPHLSGNLAGTANANIHVPGNYTGQPTGPTKTDAVVTFYYKSFFGLKNVTLAVFHVANFGTERRADGSVGIGTTGGPGGATPGSKPNLHSHFELWRGRGYRAPGAGRDAARIPLVPVICGSGARRHHASISCVRKDSTGGSERHRSSDLVKDQEAVQTKNRVFHANSNEDAKVGLVGVAADAGDRKLIMLIAHRGTTESRIISQRRLRTARQYLQYTHAIAPARIVTAQGDPVRGSGRLDVYIDGKLHTTFAYFKRNRDFAPEP